MGPSGAGKTTLLAALSGRIPGMQGTLAVNGKIVQNDDVKNFSNFVYQRFVVTESLTAFEHLNFMAALKLNLNKNEREKLILKLILQTNLQTSSNIATQNLSGGERKRLALAVELLDDPMILFCDEPTTGLDSSSALAVVEILREQTEKGRLVLLTVHQPSSTVFITFDQFILLSAGKLVFQGTHSEAVNLFNSLNLRCPNSYNPADFYMKQITVSLSTSGLHSTEHLQAISTKFSQTRTLINPTFLGELFTKTGNHTKRKIKICGEIYWLVWRNYMSTKRNMGYHIGHFLVLMGTAVVLTSVYTNVTAQNQEWVQNVKGLLFFITSELIFTHMYAVMYTFPQEHAVFIRDESLYSSYAYFISKVISLIPRNVVQPFLFLALIYFQVGFAVGVTVFLKMYCILVFACVSSSTFGLCISAVFQSLECIELFIMPLDLAAMLMAGILINIRTIPFYLTWMKYLSPFFYTYESLSMLQWSTVSKIDCVVNSTLPCYASGAEVLEELGFTTQSSQVIWNVLYLAVLSLGFCIVGNLGILRTQKKSEFS